MAATLCFYNVILFGFVVRVVPIPISHLSRVVQGSLLVPKPTYPQARESKGNNINCMLTSWKLGAILL